MPFPLAPRRMSYIYPQGTRMITKRGKLEIGKFADYIKSILASAN